MSIKSQGGVFKKFIFNISNYSWEGFTRNIAANAIKSTVSGTTSHTVLNTFTVPGGSMGPNGWLRLRLQTSQKKNNNDKIIIAKFNGIEFINTTASMTGSATTSRVTQIWNRNSESSQVSGAKSAAMDPGESNGALTTFNVDTSSDVTIEIIGKLTTSSDHLSLEAFSAEVCYIK